MGVTDMPIRSLQRVQSPWAWLALAVALGGLYAVAFDTGAISSKVASSGMYLHELFYDGRHLLGRGSLPLAADVSQRTRGG
jgi:hypothetical protein